MGYKGLELKDRVAVVIGGTSGLGRAIMLALAEAGADVVPTSRRRDQVESAAREAESLGRRALQLTSDVMDRRSLESLRDAVVREFGKADILVNAAGRTKRAPTIDLSEKDWNDIIETNLTGSLRACQVFGRSMIERWYGRIINISSLTSLVSMHEVAAYAASAVFLASDSAAFVTGITLLVDGGFLASGVNQ
jgi:NAD(P)-dependent dehydrogenase (short-subunit alcohol dehydrogenase family)